MQFDSKTGLVLEGGGMRGVFTSGVLDAFMKYQLYFNYVVGRSMQWHELYFASTP